MRVLIASLPIGTGHDIAARAMAEAFARREVDVEFSHHLVTAVRWQARLYFLGISALPGLYGPLFRLADHAPTLWRRHRDNWRQAGQRLLEHVYQSYQPDVVVATHPFALSAWSVMKERHPHLRLIAVLTDLSVHRFWYEPLADAYSVWLPEQVEDLTRLGVASEKIWPVGIPIRSSFQWDNPLLTKFRSGPVVLLGGGLGLGPYYRILRQLAELPYPVLAICGHNEKLRWQLDEHQWPERVHIVGYIEHMPSLLRNARLVVGKPGGVTAAEVAQSHVPWILTHWIAGQEEANRDRLIAHFLAVRGDTNLNQWVVRLAEDSSDARRRMLEAQEEWARPYAAEHLVDHILRQ